MKKIVMFTVIVSLISGCTIFKPFRAQKHLNLTPFAEYTISLSSDIVYGMAEKQLIYLAPYRDLPEGAEYKEIWLDIRSLLKALVVYSVEVVTLGNSTLEGPERCRALASFLDRMVSPAFDMDIAGFTFTRAQFDTMLADVQSRKKLLDGLSAAQPLVDEYARVADAAFERAKDMQPILRDAVERAIKEEHADVLKYFDILKEEQSRHFRSALLLRNYNMGEEGALAAVFENDPELLRHVRNPEKLTYDEMRFLEERIFGKLKMIRELKAQVEPDLELYRNEMLELDSLMKFLNLNLGKAKVTVVVWSRIHRKVASGVIDPAKIDIFDMTKKAVKTAL